MTYIILIFKNILYIMSTQQLFDLVRGKITIKNILKGGTHEKKEPKKKKEKKKVDFKTTNKLGIDKIPINMYKIDDKKDDKKDIKKSKISLGSQPITPKLKKSSYRKKWVGTYKELNEQLEEFKKNNPEFQSKYYWAIGAPKTPLKKSWRKSSTKSQKVFVDDEEVKI